MKVILLQDIANIGRKFTVSVVARGYAMHYLIPRGMARVATDAGVAQVESQRQAEEEKRAAHLRAVAEKLAKEAGAAVSVSAPANEKGGLYKGIHKSDILAAVNEQLGIELIESELGGNDEYKEVGDYTVPVLLDDGVTEELTLSITPGASK